MTFTKILRPNLSATIKKNLLKINIINKTETNKPSNPHRVAQVRLLCFQQRGVSDQLVLVRSPLLPPPPLRDVIIARLYDVAVIGEVGVRVEGGELFVAGVKNL